MHTEKQIQIRLYHYVEKITPQKEEGVKNEIDAFCPCLGQASYKENFTKDGEAFSNISQESRYRQH